MLGETYKIRDNEVIADANRYNVIQSVVNISIKQPSVIGNNISF
jgi:hypothetical protein